MIKAEKKAYYIGEQKDPPLITYSDEDLKAQDAAQREEHNAEVMEVRANEAKGKISFGAAIAVAGVVITGAALAVATGVTGGAAAPFVGSICGGSQCNPGNGSSGRRHKQCG